MTRLALIGYGYWGPNLARCLRASGERAQLAAICELSATRAFAAGSAFPSVPVHDGIDAVLADRSIDAVIVATPARTHAPIARRALHHGKHVFVEKPLAHSATEAAGLARAGEAHGRVFMVDHTYLFSPALAAIERVMRDRELGPLRYYHSVRSNCFGPQHDTNVLWDLALHDLSILDALMPDAPDRVQAAGVDASPGEPVAHAQLMLSYPGGAFAAALVSWVAPAKVRTIVLGFERHTIVWDDLVAGSSVQLFDRGVEPLADPDEHRLPRTAMEQLPVSGPEPLASAVEHFLDCIEAGATPRSDAASGLRIVRQLEAADASLAQRGAPPDIAMAPGVT